MQSAARRTDDREERARFLAETLDDFPAFCGLLGIIQKDGQHRKFRLNAIQRLFCIERTGRDVVLKPRQIGFSTLELARDVWFFLTRPGARVLIVCQSITGDGPINMLAATIRLYFESLRRAGLDIKFSTEKANEWHLAGRNARLKIEVAGASLAAAQKVGRAGTVDRLHCTETSVWEFAEETLNAVLECVPERRTGSEIVIESTPHGAVGLFYRYCRSAAANENGYKLHFYPWFKEPEYAIPLDEGERIEPQTERERFLVAQGVKPEQLKWYRRKVSEKGQGLTDQEYPSDPETCFLVSGRCFFEQSITTELLQKAVNPIELLDRDRVRIWKQPEPGHGYLVASDTSEGGGGDPSAAIVYDWATGEHVASLHGQYTPWELARALVQLATRYHMAQIAVERNNHGHAVLLSVMREQKYRFVYTHDDGKPGWLTNAVSRPTMLDELEDAHRQGLFKTNDRELLGQCRTFVITDTGKAEAARGEHDDAVMAAAIGWSVRQRRLHRESRQRRPALPPGLVA